MYNTLFKQKTGHKFFIIEVTYRSVSLLSLNWNATFENRTEIVNGKNTVSLR